MNDESKTDTMPSHGEDGAAGPANRVVVYDDNDKTGRAYTRVTVSLVPGPDRRPCLLVDDFYYAGADNPYWDLDNCVSQLELSASGTAAVARWLETDVAHLLESVASLVSPLGQNAINQLVEFCDAHGVPWRQRSGNALEDMSGTMEEWTSDPAPAQDGDSDSDQED